MGNDFPLGGGRQVLKIVWQEFGERRRRLENYVCRNGARRNQSTYGTQTSKPHFDFFGSRGNCGVPAGATERAATRCEGYGREASTGKPRGFGYDQWKGRTDFTVCGAGAARYVRGESARHRGAAGEEGPTTAGVGREGCRCADGASTIALVAGAG